MRLKSLHTIIFLLLILIASFADSKRSRGRSRGSSSSSSSGFWNRKNTQKSKPAEAKKPEVAKPVPPQNPKPSAPQQEPEIKKQQAGVQQNAAPPPPYPGPGQNNGAPPPYPGLNSGRPLQHNEPPPPYPGSGRPIGWNVDGQASHQNVGFKSGLEPSYRQQNVNPSYSSYPQSGAYPGVNNYGSNPGTGYNYNPQQPFPGYHPTSNIGVIPPRGADAGHYYNSMSGYGNNPVFVNQRQGGLFGGSGGYGGYGGHGGYNPYGYGMKKSGGFFGKNAFRNVLGGLLIWHLISGLTSSPYKVYNYHNQPREERQEITLPPNLLTLCNENATSICVPGSYALCTTNNTILCVSSMSSTNPCKDNAGEICVNSTIPCLDAADPLCQNKTNNDNTTTVSLPCFTNMTLENGELPKGVNITLPEGSSNNNKFCVTTMAVPDTSSPPVVDDPVLQTNQTSAVIPMQNSSATV